MNDGVANDDDRVPVEVLADEYLERLANGERVSVDEYANQYPELADDIREVFPALEAMKSLSTEWKKTVVHHHAGPKLPFQLGDYRLERQIGRGGMGVVYEAEHTSLRRRVAIKILRLQSLNTDKDIARFHREAQSAAGLHHTNIVPVFDFGEAEGFHYIAMQLIQGEGLDVVVDRLKQPKTTDSNNPDRKQFTYNSPKYWQEVAAIGIQAATALDYAHSQGTIHRDIKPANLLLDGSGIVWVADFGLARQQREEQPTQSGILSGTLRYLAPEHFHGKCDERTDQYGLGLCLYELVTLQSATDGSSSHAEIMRRITESNVVHPRKLNANIPKDLETIVLKAIAANPDNRFSDCQSLAEDLQRFVDGRPIRSRPVSRVERLWRWAKRFPALATATATSAILLVLVAVVAMIGYQAEYEQRRKAEVTSEYALEALDTVFDRYALAQPSTKLLTGAAVSTPVLSQESAQMLERLLPIFDRLAELDDESIELRLRATTARKRVGDIHQQLGQFEEAIQSYELAAEEYRVLTSESFVDTMLKTSELYNNIGICELMLGRIDASQISHSAALHELESRATPHDPEVILQMARTHFLLTRRLRPGESATASGMPGGPEHGPGPGGGIGPGPENNPDHQGGPRGRDGHGPPPQEQGWDRDNLEQAIALLESLGQDYQADPRCQHLLALSLKGLVPDQFSNRTEEEKATEKRVLGILRQLATDYPEVSEYGFSYVATLASLDTQHSDSIHSEDLPDAELRLRRAVEGGKELVAQHPYVPDYTMTLIHANNRLAHILERRGRSAESIIFFQDALKAYQAAISLQRGLIKRFPNASAYHAWLLDFERSADRLEGIIAEFPGRMRQAD